MMGYQFQPSTHLTDYLEDRKPFLCMMVLSFNLASIVYRLYPANSYLELRRHMCYPDSTM